MRAGAPEVYAFSLGPHATHTCRSARHAHPTFPPTICLAGHQAGVLYEPERGGTVRARIASVCGRDFIGACGGFTQVIARALVETPLGEIFPPEERDGGLHLTVEFDSLDVDVTVTLTDGKFDHAATDLTSFARNLLLRGFERVNLGNLHAWRAGHFLVMNAQQVQQKHPDVNFETMDGATTQLITLLQYRFLGATALTSWDFSLYDFETDGHGDTRVVFPHNVRRGPSSSWCSIPRAANSGSPTTVSGSSRSTGTRVRAASVSLRRSGTCHSVCRRIRTIRSP